MRKIEIIEIENSYLNFFTPTVIIAIGYFLYSLIVYPLVIIQWLSYENKIDPTMIDLYTLMIPNITCLLIVLFVYFVVIPRLNVVDATYRPISKVSLQIFLLVFFVVVSFRILITYFFDSLGVSTETPSPWYLGEKSYALLFDPIFLFLFLIYQLGLNPIFVQLMFRRTAIPLMEDRGLSPFIAVLLSSFGFCLLDLPFYLNIMFSGSNFLIVVYWTISTFLYGFGTGIIYVLSRNIKLSILYASSYQIYRIVQILNQYPGKTLEYSVRFLLEFYIVLIGLISLIIIIWVLSKSNKVSEWISILKKPSVPNISRGIIGFFVFSFLFALIHYLISTIIEEVAYNKQLMIAKYPDIFILYSIFYLIIFSIPFFLTITSEYSRY